MHDAALLVPSVILGAILLWVLVDRKAERKDLRIAEIDHQRQIDDLLQRIQAPDLAVQAHPFKHPQESLVTEMLDPEEIEERLRQEKELEQVGTVIGGEDNG